MATILLLHGFPFSARMWDLQRPALMAAGHRVVAPDFPGFGTTPPLDVPSLDGFAAHALAAAGDGPVLVCGLSMGGYTALRLLASAPGRLTGLVLADTRAAADTEEARGRRMAQVARIGREGKAWLADELLPLLLSDLAPRTLRERVRGWIDAAPPEGTIGALRAMAARPDATPLLRAAAVPVTAIVGSLDAMTPPAEMRAMAAVRPDTKVVEIDDAGHLANLEAPDDFNAALLRAADG